MGANWEPGYQASIRCPECGKFAKRTTELPHGRTCKKHGTYYKRTGVPGWKHAPVLAPGDVARFAAAPIYSIDEPIVTEPWYKRLWHWRVGV